MKEDPKFNNPKEGITASRTSIPTGEVVTFGEKGEFSIGVRKQTEETYCGQACLEMLGYSLDGVKIDEEKGVSIANLMFGFGAEDVDWQEEGFKFDVPHMVAGHKIKTGWNHWYLRVGNTVINPEDGKVEEADVYEQREIGEIKAVMKVPLNLTPQS
ncbi:MAG: hypothetical protein ABH816_00040 [Candidatus Levyibacteriota bacterium]